MTDDTVQVVLPFKDQISADMVKEQLKDPNLKVNATIQPVFASRKIEQELNVKEAKPPIVNEQQCVVYNFQCDLSDADYVGYTRDRLTVAKRNDMICYLLYLVYHYLSYVYPSNTVYPVYLHYILCTHVSCLPTFTLVIPYTLYTPIYPVYPCLP